MRCGEAPGMGAGDLILGSTCGSQLYVSPAPPISPLLPLLQPQLLLLPSLLFPAVSVCVFSLLPLPLLLFLLLFLLPSLLLPLPLSLLLLLMLILCWCAWW